MKDCSSEVDEIKDILAEERLDLLPKIPNFWAFLLMDCPGSWKGLSALILKDLLTHHNYSIDTLENKLKLRLANFLGLEVSELELSENDEKSIDEKKKDYESLKGL